MSTPHEPASTGASNTAKPAPPPAPKRRGMQGNAKSMVLSMIACIAGCLVLLALIPRQGATKLPTVPATEVAREVASTKKWDVAVAKGLGKPWRAVNVAMVGGDADHAERWRAGYQGSGDDYLAIQQRKNGGTAWVKQVANGSDAGTVTIAGTPWHKVAMARDQKALVRTQPLGGLDTVVTGKGTWTQVQQVAAAATPYSALNH